MGHRGLPGSLSCWPCNQINSPALWWAEPLAGRATCWCRHDTRFQQAGHLRHVTLVSPRNPASSVLESENVVSGNHIISIKTPSTGIGLPHYCQSPKSSESPQAALVRTVLTPSPMATAVISVLEIGRAGIWIDKKLWTPRISEGAKVALGLCWSGALQRKPFGPLSKWFKDLASPVWFPAQSFCRWVFPLFSHYSTQSGTGNH